MLVKGVFLVILALQCFCSCFVLPRTDPQVDRELIEMYKSVECKFKKVDVMKSIVQLGSTIGSWDCSLQLLCY